MSPGLASTISGLIGAFAAAILFFFPTIGGVDIAPLIEAASKFFVALSLFLVGYFANKTDEQMPRLLRRK